RQDDVLAAARASHQGAEHDADHARERKTGRKPQQRVEHGVWQDAAERPPPEGRADRFERRKHPPREKLGPRKPPPQAPDRKKRNRIAPDRAPVRLAFERRGDDGIGHAAIMPRPGPPDKLSPHPEERRPSS